MIQKTLLYMLEHASRDKPVTRQEIQAAFRVTDRGARKMIERLRDNGYPVVGISDQEGYWMARSEKELQVFMRDYTAKARTIDDRAARIRRKFYEKYQERTV